MLQDSTTSPYHSFSISSLMKHAHLGFDTVSESSFCLFVVVQTCILCYPRIHDFRLAYLASNETGPIAMDNPRDLGA